MDEASWQLASAWPPDGLDLQFPCRAGNPPRYADALSSATSTQSARPTAEPRFLIVVASTRMSWARVAQHSDAAGRRRHIAGRRAAPSGDIGCNKMKGYPHAACRCSWRGKPTKAPLLNGA
ncbi:hypothetical protein KCP73_08460 [Salmonella enterica subsp. enterica]|nr:hypothetical protein KCP73_08460 [Salmonella enterica subsp. enterica]